MRISPRRAGTALLALSLAGAVTGALPDAQAAPAHPTTAHHATAATAAKTAWRATATRAVTLKGTRLGATPNARTLRLDVAMSPRNAAAMKAAVAALYKPGSATYHHFLTPAQVRARYAPTSAQVAKVTAYLRSAGLTNLHVASNRMLITAHASVGTAEKAFHTSLVSYRVGGRTLFANRTAASVPSALGGLVHSVSGLTSIVNHTGVRHTSKAAAGSPSLDGLYPAQFQTTYDATGTPTGAATSIAILTAGDISAVVPDLRQAEAQEGQPQVPVTTIQVGPAGTDTSGTDEWDMDTQAASMMAGTVKNMYLYNVASLANTDLIAGVNQFVADDKAPAMSASIGGCEFLDYLTGDESTLDTIQAQGALQGQTLFASSGDEGDACSILINTGTPVGVPSTEWPASGQYTTAVGGTSLVADADGNRVLEPAWLGGGGGTSLFEAPGAWQSKADPLYAAGLRSVPDVALDADPDTAPAQIVVNGAVTGIGGTSLASPLMLGAWARLESSHGNDLGLATPALYALYDAVNGSALPIIGAKTVPGFYDVTLGTNGLYDATPGYDYTSGLGAPDVAQLDAALK